MPDFTSIVNIEIHKQLQYCRMESDSEILSAMSYGITNGGKRIRPRLLLSLLYDLTGEYEKGLGAACALEMIHTYSLIHDDLPAMDNDDYRRNQLTVHKKFGEANGILAGDALLTQAFVILGKEGYSADVVAELAEAAGVNGMIFGQELDLRYEETEISLDTLKMIHRYKTGKLLSVPLILAALIADKKEYTSVLRECGYQLGLAFQIQDDVLDVTKNLKKSGEESSDVRNQKNTYLTFKSIQQAIKDADDLYEEVIGIISSLPLRHHTTEELIESLIQREI